MVLADFLTGTRRKWMKAFKLFKTSNCRKSPRNRVSPEPELIRSPSYSGTVDARQEIDVRQLYGYRASMPPLGECDSSIGTFNSYDSSRQSLDGFCSDTKEDSAYNSARSSPAHARAHPRAVCYATVTYFNVNDSEDSSSVKTEYTLLDVDMELEEDETKQNIINESIELVSAL